MRFHRSSRDVSTVNAAGLLHIGLRTRRVIILRTKLKGKHQYLPDVVRLPDAELSQLEFETTRICYGPAMMNRLYTDNFHVGELTKPQLWTPIHRLQED